MEESKAATVKTFSRATTYIRPMLGYPVAFFGKKFYDCHISIEVPAIHLVFEKPLEEVHGEYYGIFDTLRNDPNYTSEENTGNYLILNFSVPIDLESDFNAFLDSKYSKMSDSYKEHILSLYAMYKPAYKRLSKVLCPSKDDRIDLENKLEIEKGILPEDAEILSLLDLRKEVLNIENYK